MRARARAKAIWIEFCSKCERAEKNRQRVRLSGRINFLHDYACNYMPSTLGSRTKIRAHVRKNISVRENSNKKNLLGQIITRENTKRVREIALSLASSRRLVHFARTRSRERGGGQGGGGRGGGREEARINSIFVVRVANERTRRARARARAISRRRSRFAFCTHERSRPRPQNRAAPRRALCRVPQNMPQHRP